MDREYNLRICGTECTIISDKSEEAVYEIAKQVEGTINEVLKSSERVAVPLAAIIAAMSICEELKEEKDISDNLRAQIKAYSDDAKKANNDKEDAFEEIGRLRREIESLRSRLAQNK